ncbi:MAG: NAD-dependent deacylase [Chloroflexi bacterium]|nr:MAG: NAD-dependent deacylase [Chloroflexota bacterium]
MRISIPSELVDLLRNAQHVAVLTGAGISAESGVPTFRDAQTGLWAKYDPQELATPEAFRKNPRLVWEWYAWRRELVSKAEPNPGHQALAELEKFVPQFTLITQNIDSLHTRAGSQNVIELHGNITRTKCADEGHFVTTWEQQEEVPPRCPYCGSLLRPDVVWFGESLPYEALKKALEAAQKADFFLTVGTSALVQPAASIPLLAVERGVTTVEVNPQKTPLTSYMDFYLPGPAGEVLPVLVSAVLGAK